jgi:hypothetical protein
MPISTWAKKVETGAVLGVRRGRIAEGVEDGRKSGECVRPADTNQFDDRRAFSKDASDGNGPKDTFPEDILVVRVTEVSQDGDFPFRPFLGGQPFYIRRERFDPNGRGCSVLASPLRYDHSFI